jgi:2-dehydro-3-deoxyphosphooctonate aldolase (KDO 8-P synthase)
MTPDKSFQAAREVQIGDLTLGGDNPLVLIAGPCVIENRDSTLRMAENTKEATRKAGMKMVFKSSYDKANRSSISAFRGPGIDAGLEILKEVRSEVGLPVLSDVHCRSEVKAAAEVLDALQIPAYLCRQTDLLQAASSTGKPVNVKKGQFMAPWDMDKVVEKIVHTGNRQIILTERGTVFGYNNLVADMRSLVIMRDYGYPVAFDATHTVQLPGGLGNSSGGQRQYVGPLARGAAAVGCNALYMEVHEAPDSALCDGPNMIAIDRLESLLTKVKRISDLLLQV